MTDKRRTYYETSLKTRNQDGEKYIEGYFAVFNQETELFPGWFEQIASGAFDESLQNNDIRCLFNHDTSLVLGRTSSKTLSLKADSYGLYGSVKINPKDSQAVDIYARVERGDISGCSFGFNILNPDDEVYNQRDDGLHVSVEKADTHEVSVCTFPAYPQTEVEARQRNCENYKKEILQQRKVNLKSKLEEIKC